MNAAGLAAYLERSLTAFHASAAAMALLEAAGSRGLDEAAAWDLRPGELVHWRRGSAIFACRAGAGDPAAAFRMVAAHTDSPGLRLRGRSVKAGRSWTELGCEVYGSPIVATWLDRDLALAGQAVYRDPQGRVRLIPVHLDGVRATIPNAAIHLNRDINKGFEYNAHQHLRAIVGGAVPESGQGRVLCWLCEHHLGLEPGSVLNAELWLADDGSVAWLDGSQGLLQAPRLDNLAGCHAALEALLAADEADDHQVLVLFDHEEVGSASRSGADGSFLVHGLERISLALGENREEFLRSLARSRLISVDAAHGLHPAYPEKHDPAYAPELGHGLVIKANVNQKYATELFDAAVYADVWKEQGLGVQCFTNRADMGCGSTIGPLAGSFAGVSTLDVGIPLWAMHSIRETAHLADQDAMIRALTFFYGDER